MHWLKSMVSVVRHSITYYENRKCPHFAPKGGLNMAYISRLVSVPLLDSLLVLRSLKTYVASKVWVGECYYLRPFR